MGFFEEHRFTSKSFKSSADVGKSSQVSNQQSSKQEVCSNTNCGFQIQTRTQNIKKKYKDRNDFFFDDMIYWTIERENVYIWNCVFNSIDEREIQDDSINRCNMKQHNGCLNTKWKETPWLKQ